MNMKIDALAKRLDALIVGPSINAASTYAVDSCSICASPMHSAQNCPSTLVFTEYSMEQATLSMTSKSSQLDLILRRIIQDGGTIQTFRGSRIREEHLQMLRPIILSDFRHSSTISLHLKCLPLHPNQL